MILRIGKNGVCFLIGESTHFSFLLDLLDLEGSRGQKPLQDTCEALQVPGLSELLEGSRVGNAGGQG